MCISTPKNVELQLALKKNKHTNENIFQNQITKSSNKLIKIQAMPV